MINKKNKLSEVFALLHDDAAFSLLKVFARAVLSFHNLVVDNVAMLAVRGTGLAGELGLVDLLSMDCGLVLMGRSRLSVQLVLEGVFLPVGETVLQRISERGVCDARLDFGELPALLEFGDVVGQSFELVCADKFFLVEFLKLLVDFFEIL